MDFTSEQKHLENNLESIYALTMYTSFYFILSCFFAMIMHTITFTHAFTYAHGDMWIALIYWVELLLLNTIGWAQF